MSKYLSVEDVLIIYENLIEEFGGINGLRDKAALEAAVNRPITGYYDDIIEEASALMESLTKTIVLLMEIKGSHFLLLIFF